MELTTKILQTKNWTDSKSKSIFIEVEGVKTWCSFYYEKDGVRKEEDLCKSVESLEKDQEVEFSLWKSEKGKYYINSIIPVEQVGHVAQVDNMSDDTEDPGPIEFPVGAEKKASRMANKVTTDQFKTSSYDRCNAMNASVALLAEVFNKNSDKPMDEIARKHKELIQEVKDGACIILDEYHGK